MNVNTNGNNQGKIVIGNEEEYGYATVNGTLNITDGSAVEVKAYLDNTNSKVYGALVVNGTMNIQAGTTISSNVTAPAAEKEEVGNKAYVPAQGIVVSAGANLTINGDLNGKVAICNYGNITVDNSASTLAADKTPGSLEVRMASTDATVTLTSFKLDATADNSFSVTDDGLIFKERTRTAEDIAVSNVNKIEFTAGDKSVILNGGLVFTETVTSKTTDSKTTYTNKLNVDGSVSASFTGEVEKPAYADSVVMTVTGGKAVTVTGALNLGANVAMTNAANGTFDVSGTVTNTATGAQKIINNGTVTVTGLITASVAIDNKNVINAAYYVITSGTPAVTTYNYSSLETAVPAVAAETNTATKNIRIYGTVTVKENLDVPAGITIDVSTSGAKLIIDKDATVTMQAGSKMTSNKMQVVVDGTLTFNDKTNDATTKTVSDVTVEDSNKNGYRTYTNVYNALAEATDGQTVTVTRDTGVVTLGENVTVPAGVTLVVPHNAVPLYLKNGVTMTIDGTLDTEYPVYAQNTFGTSAMNVANDVTKQSSAIVVNGTMMVAEDIGFHYGKNTATPTAIVDTVTGVSIAAGAPIYGAYYTMDGYTVVSTLAIASQNVADILGDIVINGAVNAGDVTFTGTDDCENIVIGTEGATSVPVTGDSTKTVETVLTVSTLTIADVSVKTTYGPLNGDIVVGDARVTLSDVEELTVTAGTGMTIASSGVSTDNAKGGEIVIAAGSVSAKGFSAIAGCNVDVVVASGATMVADNTVIEDLTVDGTVTVASGKNLTVTEMLVEGNGSVQIAAATDTSAPGNAQISRLYVGIYTGDFKLGDEPVAAEGTASVSGPVERLTEAYVLNSASVDASNLEDMDSIAFNVNGALWFTAYSSEEKEITVDKAPIENAVLAGWSETADGEFIPISTTDKTALKTFTIGGDYEALYAVVETQIYVINLRADQNAISSITIDGSVMQFGMIKDSTAGSEGFYYGYTAIVAAGNHTIQYQLANGYSGNGVLTVNGTQQSGLTFSTEGTPAAGQGTITYDLQLTGFEKSGYVPDSPDTGSDSGDSGMTITDYLLIVLVVLIIVMAIIVAMRLMRS